MPPIDDMDAALLAPGAALDFLLIMAYAAGWSDALGDPRLPIADARIAELIERAADTWQTRVAQRWTPTTDRDLPAWLRHIQEGPPRP